MRTPNYQLLLKSKVPLLFILLHCAMNKEFYEKHPFNLQKVWKISVQMQVSREEVLLQIGTLHCQWKFKPIAFAVNWLTG